MSEILPRGHHAGTYCVVVIEDLGRIVCDTKQLRTITTEQIVSGEISIVHPCVNRIRSHIAILKLVMNFMQIRPEHYAHDIELFAHRILDAEEELRQCYNI